MSTNIKNFIEPILKYDGKSIEELIKYIHVSKDTFKSIVKRLPGVKIDNNIIIVDNRLELILYGLKLGLPVKRLSRYINWRDFEKVSAKILSSHGYIVYTNVLFTRPKRLEIDVLGIDEGTGRTIVIDCKHWKHGISPSSIIEVGRKHIERVKNFLKYMSWISRKYPLINKVKYAIPVLVTFTIPKIRKVDNMLIVLSIGELNNFLIDIHIVLEDLGIKPITLEDQIHRDKELSL